MCLDSAIIQQFKNVDGALREYNGHWCITRCPICWVFSEEEIQASLFAGATFEYGNVYLLHAIATLGCRFAKDVMERLALTTRGDPVEPEAKLSIKLEKEGIASIEALVITIVTEGGQEMLAPWLGEGYTICSNSSYDLPYAMFANNDDPASQYIKGRPANSAVNSPATFATARRWMDECATSHENCPGFSFWADSQLPTRVIYVGSDNREVRLFLSSGINSCDATRGYAALSYVWGMDQEFKTTTENVHTRYQSLDINLLPRTIQDAIYVTRSLQIPYLWVDSICIVQDLPTDLSNEISKMAQIYRSAIVTISAAKASHCKEGFLEPRQRVSSILASSMQLPFRLPSQTSRDPSRKEGFMSRLRRVIKKNQPVSFGEISLSADMSCGHDISRANGHDVKEPVDGRAWTLQESWLSARVLIYGEGPLRMKCLSGEKIDGYESSSSQLLSLVEDRYHFFPRKDNVPNGTRPEANVAIQSIIQSWHADRDMVKIWISLVQKFSKRALSEPNDKLRALSGIATEFHNMSRDDFYAGIWKSKMTEQLLWHQVGDDPPRGLPPSYRAPSWSWAAVEGNISFSVSASISISNNSGASKPTPVTIDSCSTTVANPIERFGEVVAGELVLSASARRMSLDEVQQRFEIYVEGTPNYFSDYIVLDGGATSSLFSLFRTGTSYNMSQDISRRLKAFWFLELTREEGPAGLVLDPTEDEKYRRIAYFRLGSQEKLQNQAIEYELGGGAHKQRRGWDWEDGLLVKTMAII